jgi:hypothetical protein
VARDRVIPRRDYPSRVGGDKLSSGGDALRLLGKPSSLGSSIKRRGHTVFDLLGERNPRNMPPHFWGHAVFIDYRSAIKADVTRQNFCTVPRYWYVDVTARCGRCEGNFCFSAEEQRVWYEDRGFYVDSFPNCCRACRREHRKRKGLRQEYNRDIAAALTSEDCRFKAHVATIIDRLCKAGVDLPPKVHEKRRLLAEQIARRGGPGIA